jgi:hypothetical protein
LTANGRAARNRVSRRPLVTRRGGAEIDPRAADSLRAQVE